MTYLLEKGRLRVYCLIASLITISGLFQPWLWRGYDPYSEFNPRTRKSETHYHVVTTVSPFRTSVFRDGKLVMVKWFMDLETSFAGAVIVSAALLSIFRYDRSWIKILISLICLIACFFFFMSLGGGGLGLGSITHLGWGFKITFVGVTLTFFLSLIGILY